MNNDGTFSLKSFPLARGLQLVGGLFLVFIVYTIAIRSNPYVSAWDEENSTFYENASQALRMFSLSPTAPTAIVFWDKENQDSQQAVKAFNIAPPNVRIYGVHLSSSDDIIGIRQDWMKHAPRRASLLIDRSQLLETSFRVRTLPMVYIILPKQKKIYSYLGDIRDSKQRFMEIVKSE